MPETGHLVSCFLYQDDNSTVTAQAVQGSTRQTKTTTQLESTVSAVQATWTACTEGVKGKPSLQPIDPSTKGNIISWDVLVTKAVTVKKKREENTVLEKSIHQ